MLPFLAVLALLPLGTYALTRRLAGTDRWIRDAAAVLLLFGLGLFATAPFLTDRAVGSGEAHNYSLALADAVLQMRAGEIPPLAGQTEFAFNGRVHPLRTAPYLFYLGGAIDAVTGHRLGFWSLQNLSLAFSLLAAIHACYAGLRWGAACPRLPAVALSLLYGFCPALLTAAYWYDLFMTVHAAPFLPLALAAGLRSARDPRPRHDAVLAAALAAAWLAHPPVALWLTLCAGLARLASFLVRPSWRELLQLLGAALLAGLLAGFVFASVFTLSNFGVTGSTDPMTAPRAAIWSIVQGTFPGVLLPVPNKQNYLTHLQLGYAHWLLLGVAGFGVWHTRTARPDASWLARLGLTAGAMLLLALVLPVPVLTPWLWNLVPRFAIMLTSIWPMQRLYLVATALIIFAAVGPLLHLMASRRRPLVWGAFGLALGWTAFQAGPLLQRGFVSRWSESATRESHLSTNIDLTRTSYAYLDLPDVFVNGVMDPLDQFRLLRPGDLTPAADSLPSAPATAVLARGLLRWPETDGPPPLLRLEPHRRYRLDFSFRTPAVSGHIQLRGSSLSRSYRLPAAGNARGFGQGPAHQHSLSLWTSEDRPEEVRLRFAADPAVPPLEIAEYTLRAVDAAREPVVVHSLLPLRCTVTTPEDGFFLETCRRYLPGYAATVNGRAVTPLRSPGGQLMVPVPRGRSSVAVRYEGPPVVRWAFAAGVAAWFSVGLGLTVVGLGWSWRITPVTGWLRRNRTPLFGLGAVLLAGLIAWPLFTAWRADTAVGPLQLQLRLPPLPSVVGRAEPLVATGRTGAGDFVFVRYVDATHVQFGFDHWGVGGAVSEPIALDNSRVHAVEIRMGSFYPESADRRWGDTPAPVRTRRTKHMELLLDGRVVLSAPLPSHPTTRAEITVGLNRIGGSSCGEKFTGDILAVERLSPAHP